MASITWLDEPEAHDYTAAESYLSLLLGAAAAAAAGAALRRADPLQHPAKDLLRAAGLGVLRSDDAEVVRDLRKVKKGRGLAPALLVRGRLDQGAPLTVADGYHRICAAYHVDEDATVPVRLVDLPGHGGGQGTARASTPSLAGGRGITARVQ